MDIIVRTPKSEQALDTRCEGRAKGPARFADMRFAIVLICAALILAGCNCAPGPEEPAGTLLSITANPNSFTDAITCTVTTTTHVLIVSGRVSGRIGACCRIETRSGFRWLHIDGTEGRIRIL
jgi:hypothetical protein